MASLFQHRYTSNALPSGHSFTRASNATFVSAPGRLGTAATDIPRFTHDPVSGAALGLLLEPAASAHYTGTNYGEGGSAFTGGSNSTRTASLEQGPLGRHDFYTRIASTANNGQGQRNTTVPDDASPVLFSVFIKKGASQSVRVLSGLAGGTAIPQVFVDFDLATGAVSLSFGTHWLDDFGTDWRVTLLITNDASGNTTHYGQIYPVVGGQGVVHAGGVNVMSGPDKPSSYISCHTPGDIFEDDFERANGAPGNGWAQSAGYAGSYPLPASTDGRIEAGDYVVTPGVIEYLNRQLSFDAARLHATVRWEAAAGATHSTTFAMLSSTNSDLISNMLHLTVNRSVMKLQKRSSGGSFVDVLTHSFSSTLSLDQDYRFGAWVDGDDVHMSIDDEIFTGTDADLKNLIGSYIAYEHFTSGADALDRLRICNISAEQGRTPLPSPILRAADNYASFTLPAATREGTLVASLELPYGGGFTQDFIRLQDAAGADALAIAYNASQSRIDVDVRDGGASQANFSAVDASGNKTIALAFADDDFVYSLDGAAVNQDTSGTAPLVDRFSFVSADVAMHVARLAAYDAPLIDAALIAASGGADLVITDPDLVQVTPSQQQVAIAPAANTVVALGTQAYGVSSTASISSTALSAPRTFTPHLKDRQLRIKRP